MDSNELYIALQNEIFANPGQSRASLEAKFPTAYPGDVNMVLRTLGNAHQVKYVFDACCGHNGWYPRRDMGADVEPCKEARRARRAA
jgi:hypothetical protein